MSKIHVYQLFIVAMWFHIAIQITKKYLRFELTLTPNLNSALTGLWSLHLMLPWELYLICVTQ